MNNFSNLHKKIFIFMLLTSFNASAMDAIDFNGLEGFTVAVVTRVDGDFEGCDFDRQITLINGWKLICQNYHYHFAYSPSVAVMIKDIGSGYMVKAVIDSDIYDMQPIIKK